MSEEYFPRKRLYGSQGTYRALLAVNLVSTAAQLSFHTVCKNSAPPHGASKLKELAGA
jgi:hypothetical protein